MFGGGYNQPQQQQQQQQQQQPARQVSDLLDTLKKDFDTLNHDVNRYKTQRDDYERKVQAQINELVAIKATLSDLERKHVSLANSYKEEIMRLQGIRSPNVANNTLPSFQRNDNVSNFSFPNSIAPLNSVNGPMSPLGKRGRNDDEQQPNSNTFHRQEQELPSITKIRKQSADLEARSPQKQSPTTLVPSIEDNAHKNDHTSSASNIAASELIIPHDPLSTQAVYELQHKSVVCCVKYSSDGKYLATGSNRKAQIFSVQTGELVHTFTDPSWGGGDLYFRSVCFSPDGKFLACGAEDQTIKLYDIKSQTLFHTFVGHNMDIYSLDYSPDGKFIVSGSGDKKVKLWDVENKKCLFTLGNDQVGPKDGVTSVAISPDGKLVAAGSLDKIVRLWDTHTGYFLERYEGHEDSVYSVAFSPDGNSLASGSLDKTLKMWDLSESRSRSRCRSTFRGHTDFVLSVAFSADGKWLISGSKDRSVKFWDPRTVTSHHQLEGHNNSVISVAVNPTQNNFATGSGDCKAKVWRYSSAS